MGFAKSENCNGPVLAIGRVGALCGNVHMIEGHAWITDNALMLSANSDLVSVKYLAVTLRARNLNETANKTAQPLITGTGVLNERVPLPPLPEQRAIARYLDYVDGHIQRYIRAKERLIELLEEQKRAVINQAVTRGLDPDAPLKPSGVEWLGDIPARWAIVRTKSIFRQRNEKGFPDQPLLAATQTMGVLRKDRYDNRTVVPLKDLHLLKLVRKGDFVISLRSFQGGIEYTHDQGIISPAYTIIQADGRFAYEDYYAFLFKSESYLENLKLHVTGIRDGQNIDYTKLGRSRIPVPPLDEQRLITDRLNEAVADVDKNTQLSLRQIELIKEYRTRLIADVVTGKLDVRDAAANLPDGVDEYELSDRSYDPNRLELAEVR